MATWLHAGLQDGGLTQYGLHKGLSNLGLFSGASLDLRFADTKSLADAVTGQSLVTFTRASSGTYVGSDGLIKTATTNLLLQSETFNTTWVATRSTVSSDAAVAPNGSQTADKLILDSTANNSHFAQQIPAITAGSTISISIYVKAAEWLYCRLEAVGNVGTSDTFGRSFNLQTGAPIAAATTGGAATVSNSGIQAVGDGWYRIFIIGVVNTTDTAVRIRILHSAAGGGSLVNGDGASGFYLWGAQLEQSSTVGEYIPTTSTINSAPRFDHAITSSVTNLLLRSEEFGTTWAQNNISVSADSITSPTGAATGDKITETVANNEHNALQAISVAASTAYTLSCYAKKGERSILVLSPTAPGVANYYTWFNLDTGVVLDSTAGNTASITPMGNGWYRCAVTRTTGVAQTTINVKLGISSSNAISSYTGDGSSGLYLWGAQLEQSSTVGGYVPTTTAAATSSTTESLGLLVEEQRTNLLLRSEELDNASWSRAGLSSVTANATAAPDGNVTAESLVETTGVSEVHRVLQTISVTSGTTYSASAYFKQEGRRYGYIALGPNATWNSLGASAFIDLQTGTAQGINNCTAVVQALPGSWYRLTITATPTVTNASASITLGSSLSGSTQIYTGDGRTAISVWGAQLEAGAFPTSYIPTTTATATRSADVASITGSNFGISRTNLLLQSEDFSTIWGNVATTEVINATVAPNGTVSADEIIEDTTTASHYITQLFTSVSGSIYTFSCYVKAASRAFCFLVASGTGTLHAVSVNLTTGASSSAAGSPSNIISTAVGNGWYRVSFTYASGTTGGVGHDIRLSADGVWANRSYTGNGTGSVYAWGAQLETGTTATAYIPTTSAAVTAVDSSWFNAAQGTIYARASTAESASNPYVVAINDGTASNRLELRRIGASNLASFIVSTSAATEAAPSIAGWAARTSGRVAAAYATNDVSLAFNGALGVRDTSANLPTVNQMVIGSTTAIAGINQPISRIAYFPQRLPDSTLQALTQ